MKTSADSYPVAAFDKLYHIEDNHFWFQSRNKLISNTIKQYFGSAHNFLEIGCGTGCVLSFLSKQFPDLELFGGDLFQEGLNYAKQRLPSAKLIKMDATKIDHKNEFDLIGAFDLLEHIEQDRLVLSEVHKALRQGGGLIITVPQHSFIWSQADEYAHHVRRYHVRDLSQKLNETGFRIIRMTSFMTLLFPLMILSRLRYKLKSSSKNIPVEFDISNYLNSLFKQVQSVERKFLNMGINLPFGGSILAVARKI